MPPSAPMNLGSQYIMGDTICALATAPLPAGVAVIRLSGPAAFAAAAALNTDLAALKPRTAAYRPLTWQGQLLDNALTLTFPGPASFTGEDVVEFHTHGSLAVINSILGVLTSLPGIRQALPGEFTRRAVMNHKLDLTQAEGLADLIAASTAAQQRQALRQLNGALGEQFERWRTQALELLAQTEAAIDFPDEELEILTEAALSKKLKTLIDDLHRALGERAGERVREGLRLAIVGRPNAGKSTFINLLSGRDVAIVSPLAGTTRDVVTTQLDLAGFPVTLADTAGLRETADVIEAEGVRRALHQAESADLIVALIDAQDWLKEGIPSEIAHTLAPGRSLVILSKADLAPDLEPPHQIEHETETYPLLTANLTEATALPRLLPALEKLVKSQAAPAAEAALLTRARHRTAVEEALGALGRALVQLQRTGKESDQGRHTVAELMAQDLRDAAHAIGTVTGRTGTEDVLDVVFSTFCIGK